MFQELAPEEFVGAAALRGRQRLPGLGLSSGQRVQDPKCEPAVRWAGMRSVSERGPGSPQREARSRPGGRPRASWGEEHRASAFDVAVGGGHPTCSSVKAKEDSHGGLDTETQKQRFYFSVQMCKSHTQYNRKYRTRRKGTVFKSHIS